MMGKSNISLSEFEALCPHCNSYSYIRLRPLLEPVVVHCSVCCAYYVAKVQYQVVTHTIEGLN